MTGIAPVHSMLAAGVYVCLGTVGGPSNNTYDILRHLRITSYLANLREQDPTVIPAKTVLEMATIRGAQAMGVDEYIGSIESGKNADFIIINIDAPDLVPSWDPVSTIAYAAHGSDVDTVVVDGKILMQGRKVLTLDEEQILQDARRRSPELAEGASLQIHPRWPTL